MKRIILHTFLTLLMLTQNSCSIFKTETQTETDVSKTHQPQEQQYSKNNIVTVTVDATKPQNILKHIWSYYGYDEANFTTEPDCISLMKTVSEINAEPVHLRQHFLLNSGDGKAYLKWGSTNVYTEDEKGNSIYSWETMDSIMDAITASGCLPLVEIGFMPQALSVKPEPYRNSDTYKLDGGCFYPPKDYNKWAGLIKQWAKHSKQRYQDGVQNWFWELWNEPDISYWHGTQEEYFKLFDYTELAIHEVMPQAVLGGPHIAGARNPFLKNFLTHCDSGTNNATGKTGTRLDYIGFHAKGGTRLVDGHVRMNLGNQLRLHKAGFSTIAEFPKFKNTPIIIGEADPDGCAACPSEKFPERGYRNSPAYGAYEAAMMKYSMDIAEQYHVNLKGVVTWAFMFSDQPWFYGFRTLSTNGIHKPVLNVFKMLGQLTGNELPLTSTGSSELDELVNKGFRTKANINGLAAMDDKAVRILLWNYHDDLVTVEPNIVELKVSLPAEMGERVKVTHYRVDSTHSNAFTKWVELGSPQNPNPKQIEQLKEAMQLQTLEPIKTIEVKNQQVNLKFKLPRHAVSLIILEKADKK
jgi:xylan 1,4-beta-xylosidase